MYEDPSVRLCQFEAVQHATDSKTDTLTEALATIKVTSIKCFPM
jgi:hypothetical protein